jgi:pyruvate,water dikinase
VRIAMRSSAVGEDTEASFAGQYITELNVNRDNILHAYRSVIASKYSPRAILYRLRYGLEDWETPMCVAGIVMVDAKASGVMYTVDPSHPESSELKINAIWGLGEHLVSGEASPDAFYVDRNALEIIRQDIVEKNQKLIGIDEGGTILEAVQEDEKNLPSINDETILKLAAYGQQLETYFAVPQDVEWAVDSRGLIFILQSRPLGLIPETTSNIAPPDFSDYPILLSGGKTASRGMAVGRVFLAGRDHQQPIPPDAILVARFASPDHAALMGKIRGIITDVGSVASHLASVAREFGVPAIFDAGSATSVLKDGESVTLVADTTTIYQGMITEGIENVHSTNKNMIESPVHRRMKAVLDHISPLNLTDPKHPSFTPEGCATVHDIIRFAHENAMNEMFGIAGSNKRDVTTVKLTANFPLSLYCIDLGGGLKSGLTTCETVTAFDIESIPMKAIWSGFAHPGISWSGTVNFGFGNLMTLMASTATAEVGAGMPGGDSFAVLSGEYLNLSARFGYHYANVDTFCGEDPDQNYIALQFSGGAGAYIGRSMRIRFLSEVLFRLGFSVTATGDLLEADLTGSDRASMESILDQLGRLLAASRLLDMAIPNQDRIAAMTEAFFNGEYNFLGNAGINSLPNFYTHAGAWKTVVEDGRTLCLQDGTQWGNALSTGVAGLMGRMVGSKYQEFLDNIRAYYYFPIAIAREIAVSDAVLQVDVQPVSGGIDQAGGLVFGLMNVGNYFVLRINALEDNFNLFEFINDKRFQRATVHQKIATGGWYRIRAEVSGNTLKGYLDDALLIEYTADRHLKGYVGLWTKADSVTRFDALTIETNGIRKIVNVQA